MEKEGYNGEVGSKKKRETWQLKINPWKLGMQLCKARQKTRGTEGLWE